MYGERGVEEGTKDRGCLIRFNQGRELECESGKGGCVQVALR